MLSKSSGSPVATTRPVLVARDRDHPETARVARLDLVDHILRARRCRRDRPSACAPGRRGCGKCRPRKRSPSLYEHIDHAARAVQAGARVIDLCARHEADITQEIEHVLFVRLRHAQIHDRARRAKRKVGSRNTTANRRDMLPHVQEQKLALAIKSARRRQRWARSPLRRASIEIGDRCPLCRNTPAPRRQLRRQTSQW